MKYISVIVDDCLQKAAKIRAIQLNMTTKDYIMYLIQKDLNENKTEKE